MSETYSLYDAATGVFTGQTLTLPAELLAANLPPGLRAIEGLFNEHAQRVDLVSGRVVAWRAPRPPGGDDLRAWRWDDAGQRWHMAPTERAEQMARVARLEAGQARAIRSLVLDPSDRAARERLAEIERQIDGLGLRTPSA